jgi:uncharacterized coiled-coil protein SlyX
MADKRIDFAKVTDFEWDLDSRVAGVEKQLADLEHAVDRLNDAVWTLERKLEGKK